MLEKYMVDIEKEIVQQEQEDDLTFIFYEQR